MSQSAPMHQLLPGPTAHACTGLPARLAVMGLLVWTVAACSGGADPGDRASEAAAPPAVAAPAPAPAAPVRTRRALLVGVQEYPALPRRLQLYGPANDVRLLAEKLPDFGFEPQNITVLADGLGPDQLPTLAAIESAFAGLLQEVERDDFVYLHFSGHGSQQPAPVNAGSGPAAETDGLDEIFLPRDIGQWNGSKGSIENAMADDRVAGFVQALRNKGAFVWLVFDSCHSGDMLRGVPAGEEERERRVDFLDLVADEDSTAAAALVAQRAGNAPRMRGSGRSDSSATGAPGRTDNPDERFAGASAGLLPDAGGFVAFYAAQTWETAPEMRLPTSTTPRESHGLFSFTLLRVLQDHPDITYRQAIEQVQQAYLASNRARPTPTAEGSALDAPVFGTGTRARIEQYRVITATDGLSMAGGSLQELRPGTTVRIVPEPAADNAATIGFARVGTVELNHSVLEPVAFGGLPAPESTTIPAGAVARPVDRPIALTLRVACPPDHSACPGDAADPAGVALARAAARLGGLVEWVPPGDPAEVRLAVTADRLWLVGPDGDLCGDADVGTRDNCAIPADVTPAVRLDPDPERTATGLAENLQRVAKATNLLRLANLAGDARSGGLTVEMNVRPAAGGSALTIPRGTIPDLRNGDRMNITLRNLKDTALDVTLLLIDSRWGITQVYPAPGRSSRIAAHGADIVQGTIDTSQSSGLERAVVIAVPASGNPADFSFMTQSALPGLRGRATGARALLAQAGFEGGTATMRGGAEPDEDLTLSVLAWRSR